VEANETKATCRACPYWLKPETRRTRGQCRRFPVLALKCAADWCGEHPDRQALTLTVHADEGIVRKDVAERITAFVADRRV
jgi:hypothetical protein